MRVRSGQLAALLILVLATVGGPGTPVHAQTVQPVEWVRQFGLLGPEQDRVQAVAANGDVYVAGRLFNRGALPGQTSAGGNDAFIRKYDSSGTEVWTRQFGTPSDDWVNGLALDESGGVYVAGGVAGALPGQTPAEGLDAFVRKYDSGGTEVWTHQFGTLSNDEAFAVAVDASGGVYVVGETGDALPGQTKVGAVDAFVRKYDSGGAEMWTRQFGTSIITRARGIGVDGSGAVYVVGESLGVSVGGAFVRKYDTSGVEAWTREFGTATGDRALSVAVDHTGSLYVVGVTRDRFSDSGFVRKFDDAGNEIWAQRIETLGFDRADAVAVDGSGGVYVAGQIENTSPLFQQAFVWKYDTDGNLVWDQLFGAEGSDEATGVAVDGGRVYVAANLVAEAQVDASLQAFDTDGVEMWSRQFGSKSPFATFGFGLASDEGGNSYVAGGTNAFSIPGEAVVRKYDPAGNEMWTRQFGPSDGTQASGVDTDDGVYVAGSTLGTLPGQIEDRTGGDWDPFLRKYDPAGNEIWTRQFSLAPTFSFDEFSERASAVATDGAGGVYVVGETDGWFEIGQPIPPAGGLDAFVSKYDAAGNAMWLRRIATSGYDQAFAVAADGAGGIYVAGMTQGILPGQTRTGFEDVFVRKYDSAGNEVWTRQFGTSFTARALGVVTDSAAGVYVTGRAISALPGQTEIGNGDAFVRKYDSAGNEVWTRQFGTPGGDEALSVAAVPSGGVFVAGLTDGTLGGQTSAGDVDAFVRRYDSSGTAVATHQFGTPQRDEAHAVAADVSGGAFVAGHTSGTFPGNTAPLGGLDIFVARVLPRTPLYLRGQGSSLFLDPNAPAAVTAQFRDSASVKFAGGNPWKAIGSWTETAAGGRRTLRGVDALRAWVGLKNSDDQGTRFDLRAELWVNGRLLAAGETRCVTGVTRNEAQAREVSVSFGSIVDGMVGPTDRLSLVVSTRIGTTGNGAFCGGHANATGLRLYFDSASRPSQFAISLA